MKGENPSIYFWTFNKWSVFPQMYLRLIEFKLLLVYLCLYYATLHRYKILLFLKPNNNIYFCRIFSQISSARENRIRNVRCRHVLNFFVFSGCGKTFFFTPPLVSPPFVHALFYNHNIQQTTIIHFAYTSLYYAN